VRAVKLLSFAAALLLLPALAACGSGAPKGTPNYYSGGSTSSATTTQAPPKMNKHGIKDASGATSISVEMNDYYFSPTVIKATPGQKLTLKLSNRGTVKHNFTITSQGISRDVSPRETASVQVAVPNSGLIAFSCKYHKALGMAGELLARQPAFTG
jgi:plastocyanin